jgi:outer membrane receptor protein involved in Fe transport
LEKQIFMTNSVATLFLRTIACGVRANMFVRMASLLAIVMLVQMLVQILHTSVFAQTPSPQQGESRRGEVSGTVQNESGEAVSSARIFLNGTQYYTLSTKKGTYTLKNIPSGRYEVIATHVGYKQFSATIEVSASVVTQNITLADSSKQLGEVSVRAERQSAVQEQKAVLIKSVDIKDVIMNNTLLTDVADRIAGVRIRRSSSLGEQSEVSINGMRGTAIRIYIDGLPMEFLYPNFDISTLPLSNIKRMDVFKGVLPVDVGTDAMGGAINIITEQKTQSHARASYSIGSFATHLADAEIGFANQHGLFFNINSSYNASENNYAMRALVFENNKIETVQRFHDRYENWFAGTNFGVVGASWADELRLTVNYSRGSKELQNGARVATLAIGEAEYAGHNLAAVAKYEKSFFDNRLHIGNITSYSHQTLTFIDTSTNRYSWSGRVIGRSSAGEYTSKSHFVTYFNNIINRTTLSYALGGNHTLLFSNLYAHQQLTGRNYLRRADERDYLTVPQYLTKNIAGVQYDGAVFEKFSLSAALKRFDYIVNGAENNTFLPVRKSSGFWSYNAGLKYDVSDELSVRTSFERGFLIPLFQQFVGNGADILRNTDLIPESSDNLNVGLIYKAEVASGILLNANINGFWREQYNIIFLGSTLTRRYENSDQVNTLGLEADCIVTLNSEWTWRSNITALRKVFTRVQDPRNSFLVGSAFPNHPTLFGNTELEWQRPNIVQEGDKLRISLFYLYVAPFNHIIIGTSDTPTISPNSFVPVQHRVDAGVSYRFAQLPITAAFNVVNVLNAELFDNFLVPRAGINANFKLIVELTKL